TGVISVVGGWFLSGGAAFVGAGIIVTAMHYGGHWVMFLLGTLTVVLLIRSNRRYRKRPENDKGDALFQTIITTDDKEHIWPMLMLYITEQQQKFMSFAMSSYMDITAAFISDNAGMLGKAESNLTKQKDVLKSARRKETLCLGHVSREVAIEKSAWFYLSNNCCMGMLYNLRRINEVCKEHVDNNFFLLPKEYGEDYERVRSMVGGMLGEVIEMLSSGTTDSIPGLRRRCDELKDVISATYHRVEDQLHEGDAGTMTVLYVYVNMLQETQELVSSVRKYLRAFAKLRNPDYRSRR
ncbi:MAG: hypothetical protein K2K33_10050, partial [Muribaculaceae bacterium]|nr:hypothetical protein [Muribaculaceae bacterium]